MKKAQHLYASLYAKHPHSSTEAYCPWDAISMIPRLPPRNLSDVIASPPLFGGRGDLLNKTSTENKVADDNSESSAYPTVAYYRARLIIEKGETLPEALYRLARGLNPDGYYNWLEKETLKPLYEQVNNLLRSQYPNFPEPKEDESPY
jgi:hypothetical protein